MRTVIFANGEIQDYTFCQKYLLDPCRILCCDGGVRHVKALGILPDCILGDLDSADPQLVSYYKNQGVIFSKFPTHKDYTDLELGLIWAIEEGADEIIMLGCIGSRFDHSLANVHLLLFLLKKGVRGVIANEYNEICLIDHDMTVYGNKGDTVSLLPLTMEVTGITLSGFLYPLKNETLYLDGTRGISNVLQGTKGTISIQSGYLLVIKARDGFPTER